MKRLLVSMICLCLLCGCDSWRKKPVIVTESKRHFFIPAGTTFKARVKKNGPLVDIVLEWGAWVTSGGYMLELHKDARREALGLPD